MLTRVLLIERRVTTFSPNGITFLGFGRCCGWWVVNCQGKAAAAKAERHSDELHRQAIVERTAAPHGSRGGRAAEDAAITADRKKRKGHGRNAKAARHRCAARSLLPGGSDKARVPEDRGAASGAAGFGSQLGREPLVRPQGSRPRLPPRPATLEGTGRSGSKQQQHRRTAGRRGTPGDENQGSQPAERPEGEEPRPQRPPRQKNRSAS